MPFVLTSFKALKQQPVFYHQSLEEQVQRGLLVKITCPDTVGHTASAATLSSTFLTVTVSPGKDLVLGIWYLGRVFAASGDDADSQSNISIVDSSFLDWRRHFPRQTFYQSLIISVPHNTVNSSVFEKILPMRIEQCIDIADIRLVHTDR